MSFNAFIQKYCLKNEATSTMELQNILCSLALSDVGIFLRDGLFRTDIGIVNLHPTKRTHWLAYINHNYFHSYGCSHPQKLSRFIIKRSGICFFF